LLHFPVGILSYRLAVDPIAVNRWLVFAYAVVGHACVLVFAWEMLLGADRGNPFVSAFVGGLIFGAMAGSETVESVELAELGGSLLSLVLWFVFGAGFVIPAFQALDARIVVYALCSLTVVRMIPVAVALLGAGQDRATVAFIGWFGPRGLASVVFALLAIEDLGDSDPRVLAAVHTIAVTIVFSIVAHGLTARPLAGRYVSATKTGADDPSASPDDR
jgi:NhaP-type Na+/H+ or K+/H+ antiporter